MNMWLYTVGMGRKYNMKVGILHTIRSRRCPQSRRIRRQRIDYKKSSENALEGPQCSANWS